MPSEVEAGYDAIASEYARHLSSEIDHKPFDRMFLGEFAAEIGRGEMLDLGCGPGHIGAYLSNRVDSVLGVDISSEMILEARSRYPGISFEVGDMRSLRFEDGRFAAILAYYSIVHFDGDGLSAALAEMYRVLAKDGVLCLAFHIGDEVKRVEELWGVPTCLHFHFHRPDAVKHSLEKTGFSILKHCDRPPYSPSIEAQTDRCYFIERAS